MSQYIFDLNSMQVSQAITEFPRKSAHSDIVNVNVNIHNALEFQTEQRSLRIEALEMSPELI